MLALGRELGAEETIDYEQQGFVLDSVGGDVLGRSLSATALRVRLVTVGNSSQQPVTFEPRLLYCGSLAVSGFSLAAQSATGGPVAEVGSIAELFRRGQAASGSGPRASAARGAGHSALPIAAAEPRQGGARAVALGARRGRE